MVGDILIGVMSGLIVVVVSEYRRSIFTKIGEGFIKTGSWFLLVGSWLIERGGYLNVVWSNRQYALCQFSRIFAFFRRKLYPLGRLPIFLFPSDQFQSFLAA